jgi:CO/xanthine dehydrogenase FAD-binding subunit
MNARTFSPNALPELFSAWADTPDARLLAGGTDLLVRLRDELEWPPLIDVSRLADLSGITLTTDMVRIGALTTYSDIEHNAPLMQHAAALAQAAALVGSPQIRNRGTIGGNLANASPAGDTIPPLYVLDAQIVLLSQAGERRVAIADFFTGPGRSVLQPCELVAAVEFPLRADRRSMFVRLGQRQALAISKVSVAVSLQRSDTTVSDIRVALGAVAPTVVRAPLAESALQGKDLNDAAIAAAADAAARDATPIDDIRSNALYRRAMCRELVTRALHALRNVGD